VRCRALLDLLAPPPGDVGSSSFENNKETLADFLDRWKARLGRHVSPKTRERYSELLRNHVRPHIGARRLQAIRIEDLNRLYADLHQKLAPRTIKQSIVPRDNQGETAASIRMRMRRGWTAVARA
jgi:hypothetical protein